MKKESLLLASLVVLLAACEKEHDNKVPADPELTGIEITEMVSKTIIAGDPAAITIRGGEFDEEFDRVLVGWEDADTIAYEEVLNGSLDIRKTRISFGLDCYSQAREHTVKVYLWRDGFQKLAISGDIEVKTADVSDGFIPDKQFYADLTCKNPSVTAMTGTCGLIDVAAARVLEREPNPGEGWPFDISWAVSGDWRGLDLFESLGSKPVEALKENEEGMNMVAWYCPNVKELDLSNFKSPVKWRGNSCQRLEKFICGPNMWGASLEDNPNLKYVDMHLSNKAVWLELSGSNVEYLDLRHCQKGVEGVDYLSNCESGWKFGTGIKDNCLIKIDSYYLIRHWVDNAWIKIYNAWTKGATIEVYSCIEIDEKLGTVPSYTEDPDALSPTSWDILEGEEYGYSTNGYVVDDPHTERDESARRES